MALFSLEHFEFLCFTFSESFFLLTITIFLQCLMVIFAMRDDVEGEDATDQIYEHREPGQKKMKIVLLYLSPSITMKVKALFALCG